MRETLRVILLCAGLLIAPIGTAIEPAPQSEPAEAVCCCGSSSRTCNCGCAHAAPSKDDGAAAGWAAFLCGCESAPAPLPAAPGGADVLRVSMALPALNVTLTNLNSISHSAPITPSDALSGSDALAFLQTVVLTV